jgi:hypothetical protein
MLDQQLIYKNIQHARSALVERQAPSLYSSNLFLLQNFFLTDVILKFKELVTDPDIFWETVEQQNHLNRQKISWSADTVIEEVHEICSGLTATVNELFPSTKLNFWGVSLWKDQSGYDLSWHTDNKDIDVSIQIYLFSVNNAPGTQFLINKDIYVVPFVSNTGYLSCNSTDDRLMHRTEYAVPTDTIRYSLYAVWSRIPKKVPNT